MVSESDLYNYFTYEKKYIEVGPPAYVVLEGLDYSKQSDLDMVSTISNSLSQLSETV
jgi:Niemann-Pick C1 protein